VTPFASCKYWAENVRFHIFEYFVQFLQFCLITIRHHRRRRHRRRTSSPPTPSSSSSYVVVVVAHRTSSSYVIIVLVRRRRRRRYHQHRYDHNNCLLFFSIICAPVMLARHVLFFSGVCPFYMSVCVCVCVLVSVRLSVRAGTDTLLIRKWCNLIRICVMMEHQTWLGFNDIWPRSLTLWVKTDRV